MLTRERISEYFSNADYKKYNYLTVDACGSCIAFHKYKPHLKRFYGNWVWVVPWYVSLFNIRHSAMDLEYCDVERESISRPIRKENAKCYKRRK